MSRIAVFIVAGKRSHEETLVMSPERSLCPDVATHDANCQVIFFAMFYFAYFTSIPLRVMCASNTSNTLSSYLATYKAAAPMQRS